MSVQHAFSPETVGAASSLVIQHQTASISLLQRRLKLGFGTTQRLMARLEAEGIVTASDAFGARYIALAHTEGNPEFKQAALQKFAGCEGGDPGEPGRPSVWLFGIQPSKSGVSEEPSGSAATSYASDLQKTGTYNRNASTLLAAIHGYQVEDYLAFAKKHQPFLEGSRGFFKGNLFPFPCETLKEWEVVEQQATGFASKHRYLRWCRSHRLPVVQAWADMHRPDLVICAGLSHLDDFAQVFLAQRSAGLTRHDYGRHKKALFHRTLNGRLVVAMEHLSGACPSDQELQEVGEYIARLRQHAAQQASS